MRKRTRRWVLAAMVMSALSAVASCGGGGGGSDSNPPPSYTIGGTVSGLSGAGLILRNNGSDDLSISSNGTFTFSTHLADGGGYAVAVATQPISPGQVCTVLRNGSGTVSGTNVTAVVVDCTSTRFAYAVNDQDSTVSIYTVDAASGRLRHNGYLPVGGNNPRAVAVDPTNRFVFVSNHGSPSGIRTYAIDAASGALSQSSFRSSDIAYSMAFDPTGAFLFAAGFAGAQNVLAYSIDPVSGALTAVPGSPFTAGSFPAAVAVHPSGGLLYVVNSGSDDVSAFAINAADGSLVSAGTFSAGSYPQKLSIDPSGRFLYVVNANSGNISVYSINIADGGLTEVAGSPFSTGIGNPNSLVVSPTGRFAYLTGVSGSVAAFNIDPGTGVLTAVAGSPVSSGTWPADVAVDAAGAFVYVANSGSHDLSVFKVDPVSGALTAGGKISARNAPFRIAVAHGAAPATYLPRYAYAANAGSGDISQYTIGSDGALTSMATPTVAAGSQPRSVTVDPFGKFAYAANYVSNTISAFTVSAITGELTEVAGSPFAAGTSPTAVRVDTSGRFVYASNYGWPAAGSVSAYAINPASGALTPLAGSPFAAGNGSSSLAVDPAGRFVYASNLLNDTVTAFSINSISGVLSRIDFDAGTAGTQDLAVTNARPVAIRVDPTGRFTYLATACGNPWAFTINATSGTLTRVDSDPGGLCGASADAADSLVDDPLGRYLYLANYNASNAVSAYGIDGVTGALAAVAGSPFTAENGVRSVSIDPSGKYAYTANASSGSNNISQYMVGQNGSLTALTSPTTAAGAYPQSIVTTGTVQ